MAYQVSEHKHRHRRHTGLVSAIAVSALVGGSVVAASATAFASPIGSIVAGNGAAQRIGAAPQAPQGAVSVGTPAGDTVLQLGVSLQPRNPAELQALAKAVTTKGNSLYHHYLAKGQFGKLYGATPQTVAAVDAELRAQGLTPGPVSEDGLSIPVTTDVTQAGKAFATGFTSYRLQDGSTGYLNTSAPRFSADVAADVVGVTGMNATFRPAAQHVVTPLLQGALKSSKADAATTAHKAPNVSPADGTATGPQLCTAGVNGVVNTIYNFDGATTSDGNGWYSAQNLASVYGMQHTSTTGQGVTIGVLEYEQYSPSDLAAYQSCYGTKVPVSVVPVDHGSSVAPNPANNIGIESLLDLEDLTSLAPGASIVDYEGPALTLANGTPNNNFTDSDWLDPMRRVVTDDNAQVVSISYGGCELDNDATVENTENWTFIEAALQGQTVLNSSGDSGATSCLGDGTTHANSKVVSDPASQPFVTAVGGTSLHGDAGSVARTSWSTPAAGTNPASGSGGGTSQLQALTSADDYQSGFTGPGFNASACKPAAGATCRQVPDVSALADPNTGYPVYVGGQWVPIGGTSGASPTWAALIAQTDASSTCLANGPAGFINPVLYQAARTNYAGTFADVTQSGSANGPAMPAGVGYDLSTGLGEPNGAAVTAALCAAVPAPATGASTYHPVTPTRLLDTRSAKTSAPQVSATGMASVQIEGNTAVNIPAGGVTAVVLNVTVTHTAGPGNLTAWGDGTARPKTSNLNWAAGDTISNLVTVPLSGDGYVDFYTTAATDVIADVQGYYTNDATGAEYVTLTPQRLLDTRSAIGVPTKTPINYGTVNVPIRGVANIPQTATAVVLNITAVGTTGAGFISAYPSGGAVPNVSNINWSKSGTTLPGLAVVPIGSNGSISLEVHGNSQVLADVFGYFDPTGTLKYTKTGPQRLLDTRSAVGIATTTPIQGGQTVKLQVTGGTTGVPAGVQAVVLNVTVTGTTGSGNLSAYADGSNPPTTSNLNWVAGWTVPNLVMVPVGPNGVVDLHVTSTTHVIADVFGYFS